MYKLKILQRIIDAGIIGIVRANSGNAALQMAQACIDGGVTTLEISFTTPDTLDVIKLLRQRHGEAVLVGAGTVLDAETARIAILAGAQFILAPNLNEGVIRTCSRYQVVSMPGVSTATEVVQALEAGADIVKVFPGDTFGPAYFKALQAPLPHAPLMPSGGVSLENLETWFANGAVAVGVGGSLTAPGALGDYAGVTANARAFVGALSRIQR
jgi:2-dehydro-3-deoxyphosphogluconate aldolase/(4S)-4-hydroxy-2-oxoglutarate aldolase